MLPVKARRQLSELVEGNFVERSVNVLAFGLPGRGKTHFLAALGRELILWHSKRVLFRPVFKRVGQLLAAKRDLRLEQELKKLLVRVRGVSGEIILVVTNLSAETISAADLALLYKQRWGIEYFFRWGEMRHGLRVLDGGKPQWGYEPDLSRPHRLASTSVAVGQTPLPARLGTDALALHGHGRRGRCRENTR